MIRLFSAIRNISDYFQKYWWSFIQDSQYYFCDKNGKIILPESYFSHNPFRHFLMSVRYDLKYWNECDCEESIFESKNYNLKEINKVCKKYGIKPATSVQVCVNGKYVGQFDDLVLSEVRCCFCKKIIKPVRNSVFPVGNSTWPIYFKEDGERNRCCDKCNKKYVAAARKDKSLIMKFRVKFGIDYSEYKDD